MSNKITEKTRQTVSEMFKNGTSKAEIARKCGISPRSVGRIIDNDQQDRDDTTTAVTAVDPMKKNYDGLLPCPLCGGEARIKAENLPPEHCDYAMSYYAECTKCHLMTMTVKTGLREWYEDKEHKEVSTVEAINKIINIWNRRYDDGKGVV